MTDISLNKTPFYNDELMKTASTVFNYHQSLDDVINYINSTENNELVKDIAIVRILGAPYTHDDMVFNRIEVYKEIVEKYKIKVAEHRKIIKAMKAQKGIESKDDLTSEDLKELAEQFKAEYEAKIGIDYPLDAKELKKNLRDLIHLDEYSIICYIIYVLNNCECDLTLLEELKSLTYVIINNKNSDFYGRSRVLLARIIYASGEHQKAMELLQNMLDKTNLPEACYYLAVFEAYQADEALANDLKNGIVKDKRSYYARVIRLYESLKSKDEYLVDFQTQIRMRLRYIYHSIEDYDNEIRELKELLKGSNKKSFVYQELGKVQLEYGNLDEAEACFKQLYKNQKQARDTTVALEYLIEVEEKRGNFEKAEKYIDQLLKIREFNMMRYYHVGKAYLTFGLKDKALEFFNELTGRQSYIKADYKAMRLSIPLLYNIGEYELCKKIIAELRTSSYQKNIDTCDVYEQCIKEMERDNTIKEEIPAKLSLTQKIKNYLADKKDK